MGTLIDRITIQFYEEEKMDKIILNILSETPKRNRAYKIKELLSDYFRKEMPQAYEKARQQVQGNMEIVAQKDTATITPKESIEQPKEQGNANVSEDNLQANKVVLGQAEHTEEQYIIQPNTDNLNQENDIEQTVLKCIERKKEGNIVWIERYTRE